MENSSKIKTLLVNRTPAITNKISEKLVKSLHISLSMAETLFEAIELQPEEMFDLVFITDQFSLDETDEFFRDILKVRYSESCVFVRICTKPCPSHEVERAKKIGFSVIVSAELIPKEVHLIKEALNERATLRNEKKLYLRLTHHLEQALSDIDEVAFDRKRGYNKPLSKASEKAIALETKDEADNLRIYFDRLVELATSRDITTNYKKLSIPKELLKRKLPNLTDDTYKGASRRVWKKLQKRYGS